MADTEQTRAFDNPETSGWQALFFVIPYRQLNIFHKLRDVKLFKLSMDES